MERMSEKELDYKIQQFIIRKSQQYPEIRNY